MQWYFNTIDLQDLFCLACQDKPRTDVWEPGSPSEKPQTTKFYVRVHTVAHQDGFLLQILLRNACRARLHEGPGKGKYHHGIKFLLISHGLDICIVRPNGFNFHSDAAMRPMHQVTPFPDNLWLGSAEVSQAPAHRDVSGAFGLVPIRFPCH